MRSLLASMSLLFAITACSTSPVPTSAAQPVPSDRLLNRAYLQPRPDSAEIVLKRDSGFASVTAKIRVFMDGVPIADLYTSEKVTIYPPAGYHVFSANYPQALFGLGNIPEVAAELRPGDRRAYRVGILDGILENSLVISPTAF
ncbi:hypothetical protein TMPK1_24500 [Rhodospirillales bacterium TMPK1]|uniref:Uncharacterized protein n=1 Tax=Roseiterribacter gracilis TaxID=2812848 RepID=A0A8S8X9T2_9PROT|nr:hypothetical protein TMPK1_24500 [Rhodospirillales bacterium TMPK1]